MNSADFLDALKHKNEWPTDYRLGKELGIAQARISMYRTGKRQFDEAACRKVAKSLDVPAGYVLASVQAERAKCTEDRAEWEWLAHLAKKSKAAAALVLVAISGALAPSSDAVAAALQCILC